MKQERRKWMGFLKLIGVVLFLWILSRIDLQEAWHHLRASNGKLLLASLLPLFGTYLTKAWRWHVLTQIAGLHVPLGDSWRIYMIGAFLGNLTPAKIGELGRIAYLKEAGMHGWTALALSILDRLLDVIAMGLIGIAAAYTLFGTTWFLLCLVIALVISAISLHFWRKFRWIRTFIPPLSFLHRIFLSRTFLDLTFATLLSWVLYFAWAVTLARSIGIATPLPPLIAAFVITGILSLLPIAPAGLGTRDASLLVLLAPFGVRPALAVSLSFLMFLSILASSLLGGWYLLKNHR
ncbi:MAG: lysylphosphatidylglycerol synthase transmembrane domain-containing protein [Candidatus Peregrinibacteria bacterium]|nr:lysylphosphatidylglycerol synthase transmembrane domain-containing protein [Candidatus Peregrinibacteria bacterium]